MNIKIHEQIGEIYDFFFSIWMCSNKDILLKRREENGFPLQSSFDTEVFQQYETGLKEEPLMKRYTHIIAEPSYILPPDELFREQSVRSLLNKVRTLDEKSLHYYVSQIFTMYANGNGEETTEEDYDTLLKRLEALPIPADAKWEFILLLTKHEEYLKTLTWAYEKNLPLYESLLQQREVYLSDFERHLRQVIEQEPAKFIASIRKIYDIEGFETLHVAPSAFIALQLSFDTEGNVYLIVGPNLEHVLTDMDHEQDISTSLVQLRNICEPSKYAILRYLRDEEHFGQEIAEKLELTKPTVSHHLNYLISQNWVTIRQAGVRMYYKLNQHKLAKDLSDIVKVIQKDLKL